jgi:hypothetical protein
MAWPINLVWLLASCAQAVCQQILAPKAIVCENVMIALYALGDVDHRIQRGLIFPGVDEVQDSAFMLMVIVL